MSFRHDTELQGRFPIRVELEKLTTDDFVKILTHPQSALIKQYTALLSAEDVELEFNSAAIRAVAELASSVIIKWKILEQEGSIRLCLRCLNSLFLNTQSEGRKN